MKAPRFGNFARVVIVLCALLALLITGGWQLLHSGLFVVRDVQIVGVEGAQSEAARQAAALSGQRLFSLDEQGAVARVQALPWVKSATISTSLPSHVTLAITPRSALGVWRIGAVNYLVAADGVVIGTADDSGPLPVVDATDGTPIQVGDRLDPDPLLVASRVDDFASATLQQTVSRISYARDTGVTVLAGRGVQVVLGDSNGLDFKLAEWRAVVQQTKPSDLHVLDLRGDRPYFR